MNLYESTLSPVARTRYSYRQMIRLAEEIMSYRSPPGESFAQLYRAHDALECSRFIAGRREAAASAAAVVMSHKAEG